MKKHIIAILLLALCPVLLMGCINWYSTAIKITQNYEEKRSMSKNEAVQILRANIGTVGIPGSYCTLDSIDENGIVYEQSVKVIDKQTVPARLPYAYQATVITYYHMENPHYHLMFSDIHKILRVYTKFRADSQVGSKSKPVGVLCCYTNPNPYRPCSDISFRPSDQKNADDVISALLILCPNVK